MNRLWIGAALALTLCAAIILAGCSGGSSTTTTKTMAGTTTVTLSDPPTCSSSSSPAGPFSSVFVTITDVQINASSTAGDNDSSWMDLTPDLKNSPKTVDLLSSAASQCFLATLGASSALPAGSYQQIRVILASTGTNSSCGSAGPNCVILASNPGSPQPLLLSSQDKTGLKIPSGQIAGGQFTVTAGQNKTLNIDFDACASIVTQGNGQFRLKPVLHAGEVNTTSSAVDGKLVDSVTKNPIVGGTAIVALEQKDSAGVDRMVMQTRVDSSGSFSFCPVPAGTYDVVALAVNGSGVSYAPAIITGVSAGNSLGNIPMTAVTSTGGSSTALGSIAGTVTTVNGATPPVGVAEDVTLSVLATAGSGNFTIPLVGQSPPASTATVTTAASSVSLPCTPTTAACASYTLMAPGVTPQSVAFTSGTAISFTGGATSPASYNVEGAANCSPSKVTVAVTVAPGAHSVPDPAPPIALVSCQ